MIQANFIPLNIQCTNDQDCCCPYRCSVLPDDYIGECVESDYSPAIDNPTKYNFDIKSRLSESEWMSDFFFIY